MKINEHFGDIPKLAQKLADWGELPISVVVRANGEKKITFLFENFSEDEVVNFFKDNLQSNDHSLIGYLQDDNYGDVLMKCDHRAVLYFEGLGDKVYAYTDNATLRLKNKLYEIEELSNLYVRISKAFIVNILTVKRLYPALNGKIIIELSDGQNLTVTRRYKKQFLEYLQGE